MNSNIQFVYGATVLEGKSAPIKPTQIDFSLHSWSHHDLLFRFCALFLLHMSNSSNVESVVTRPNISRS